MNSLLYMQHEVALMYAVVKMEQQNTTGEEGVEIVQNIPFEDEALGNGQYTSKIYLQRYLQFFFVIILLSCDSVLLANL